MKTLTCALALASLLVSPLALAQPRSSRAAPRQEPVTVYDERAFTDDLVRGDLRRPDGEVAWGRTRQPPGTLIRIRPHFVPEMLKSVENQ